MCLICIEWVKNSMTLREVARSAEELDDGSEHARQVSDLIETATDWASGNDVSLDSPIKPNSIKILENKGGILELPAENSKGRVTFGVNAKK